MKLFNAILLSTFTVVMVACGGNSQNTLLGTWQVTDVDMSSMLETVPEEQKAFMEAMLPMMQEAMKSMTMEFSEDGKVITKSAVMGEQSEEEGTWSLSDDAKTLTINGEGNSQEMQVTELTNAKMVVKIVEEDGEFSMTFEKK